MARQGNEDALSYSRGPLRALAGASANHCIWLAQVQQPNWGVFVFPAPGAAAAAAAAADE